METTAPFDLNRAIQCWRENLAQSPAFRSENLNELESHLRDSIISLEARGLSEAEAFEIAAKRIGKGGALEVEFAKVNQRAVWLDRILWMLVGIQLWGLVSAVSTFITRSGFALGLAVSKHSFPHEFNIGDFALPGAIYALIQMATIAAGVAFCWWLMSQKGRWIGRWVGSSISRRSTLIVTCVGLCLILLVVQALNYGFTIIFLKYISMEAFRINAACSQLSLLILWPIQTVVMMGVTLILVRKHFRLGRA
jgi:hypothetical protein